jgi:hypothetical protein
MIKSCTQDLEGFSNEWNNTLMREWGSIQGGDVVGMWMYIENDKS